MDSISLPVETPSRSKAGRPSHRNKAGQRAWHKRLVAAGRPEEAAEWAKACNLLPPPVPPAAPALRAPSAAACPAPAPAAPAPTSAGPASPAAAPVGGEGVNQAEARQNVHTSTPIGQILQCEVVAAGPAVAAEAHLSLPADSLPLIGASPKGEVEGVGAGRQDGSISGADAEGVKVEECLGGWPAEVEGVVGIRCRNKWYVEVQVGEKKWAKAEIGGRVLTYAERRMVRRVWVSADGRDAEYEFVSPALEIRPEEPEPVIEPVAVAPVAVEEAAPAAEPDYNPSATDFMEQARNAAYAAYSR